MKVEHQDTSHGDVAVYQCEYCTYSSYDKTTWDRHVKSKHLGKSQSIYTILIPKATCGMMASAIL